LHASGTVMLIWLILFILEAALKEGFMKLVAFINIVRKLSVNQP